MMRFYWLLWALGLGYLAYDIQQHEFYPLLAAYTLAFLCYVFMCFKTSPSLKSILWMGLFIRIVIIPAFPKLSDDIYRYLWDGLLVSKGHNPYIHRPSEIEDVLDRPDLICNMNSSDYFALYPAIPQGIFGLCTTLSQGNLYRFSVLVKLILLLFEMVGLLVMIRMVHMYSLPVRVISLYLLNPLVILETYGNAHFDVVMMPFLLAGIYYLQKQKWMKSGIHLSLAIASKLVPIITLPVFLFKSGKKRRSLLQWSLGFGLGSTILFSPMLIHWLSMEGMRQSAGLFIQRFEFNAGLYFALRDLSMMIIGYNPIHYLGPGLFGLGSLLIIYLSYQGIKKGQNEAGLVLSSWMVLLLTSTTIHPWYLIVPMALVPMVRGGRWVLVWSYLVIFSYAHYAFPFSPYWVYAEYLLLTLALIITKRGRPGTAS